MAHLIQFYTAFDPEAGKIISPLQGSPVMQPGPIEHVQWGLFTTTEYLSLDIGQFSVKGTRWQEQATIDDILCPKHLRPGESEINQSTGSKFVQTLVERLDLGYNNCQEWRWSLLVPDHFGLVIALVQMAEMAVSQRDTVSVFPLYVPEESGIPLWQWSTVAYQR